jgi:hypothetical protein
MTAERTYTDYLVDILDAIVKTEQFTQGMTFERFVQDDKTVFAVVRALEIIGEATKRVPASRFQEVEGADGTDVEVVERPRGGEVIHHFGADEPGGAGDEQ